MSTLPDPSRRQLLAALAATGGGLAGAGLHGAALAQGAPYPNRPIRIITPFNAGGAIDVLCRVIAEKLATQIGQPVLVEARPGATTILGATAVAKSPADGYTLMITTSGTTITNPVFFEKLPYDPVKDFAPITLISIGTVLLAASATAPYSSLPELAAWARTHDKPVTFGSWGVGSSGHLFGERLKNQYGIRLNHVAYKGDQPAYVDIRNGVLDLSFGSPVSAKSFVQAGALKIIGMTGPRRSPTMPEVPMFSEQGFAGFELAGYVGAYAPAGTPKPVIDLLAAELRKAIRTPEITARLIDQGQDPVANSPEEFLEVYRREFPKWEALIKESGVKLSS